MAYQDLYVGSGINPTGSKKTSDYINRIFGIDDFNRTGYASGWTRANGTTQPPANVDLTARGSSRLQNLATDLLGAYVTSRGEREEVSYEVQPAAYVEAGTGSGGPDPMLLIVGVVAVGAFIYLAVK